MGHPWSTLVWHSSGFRYFRPDERGGKLGPGILMIFLMEKLRPRPLGNFPQFP